MFVSKTIPKRYVEMYHHIIQLEKDWDEADAKSGNTSTITSELTFWRSRLALLGARQRILDVLNRYDAKSHIGLIQFRYMRQCLQDVQTLTVADKQLLEEALAEHKVEADPEIMVELSKIKTV